MKAIFSKERVGFRFNNHVLYSAIQFEDKGYRTGDIFFEGKKALSDLKKYCIKNNYNTLVIMEGKKQDKIYTL